MRDVLATLIYLFTMVIFVRVILSWFPSRGVAIDAVRDWTGRITEPVLGPVRRVLPSMGGLDLSPVVVLLVLQVVRAAIVG